MSGMEGFAIPAAGAAIGAIANKKNPIQGAMMGGLMGYGAGQMMPGMMGATGATGAGTAAAAGMGGGTGVAIPAGFIQAGSPAAMAQFPMAGGVMEGAGAMSSLGAGGFAGASPLAFGNMTPAGIAASQSGSLFGAPGALPGMEPLPGSLADPMTAAQQGHANALGSGLQNSPSFPQTPTGSLSTRGIFDKVIGNMTDSFSGDKKQNPMASMAMKSGMGMMGNQGQQQRQQQPVMGAAAPPLNPSAGAGSSFMSGAPGGTTINTLPGGTLPTASRFRRRNPSNSYSDYGLE